jgi:hypothetical protein
LEGKEFAYDETIRRIESWQKTLDILSFLLAVWGLFILWVLLAAGGDSLRQWHDTVSLIGAGLSLAVGSIIVCSWRYDWRGQVERKRKLSETAHTLIEHYRRLSLEDSIDAGKLDRWEHDVAEFEAERKHYLGTLRQRMLQLGWQDVAIRNSEISVDCQVCRRTWGPEMARTRNSWRSYFFGCEGCGVYDGRKPAPSC